MHTADSHGGFNRIDALNHRINASLNAHAASEHAVEPTQPPATER